MNESIIIVDDTIKYMNARNMIDERLVYAGENQWSRGFEKAFKFPTIEQAVEQYKKLLADGKVKILKLLFNGPNAQVQEIIVNETSTTGNQNQPTPGS